MKKEYKKPTITSEGNVESITLKRLGYSDAMLFAGSKHDNPAYTNAS